MPRICWSVLFNSSPSYLTIDIELSRLPEPKEFNSGCPQVVPALSPFTLWYLFSPLVIPSLHLLPVFHCLSLASPAIPLTCLPCFVAQLLLLLTLPPLSSLPLRCHGCPLHIRMFKSFISFKGNIETFPHEPSGSAFNTSEAYSTMFCRKISQRVTCHHRKVMEPKEVLSADEPKRRTGRCGPIRGKGNRCPSTTLEPPFSH